MTRTRKAAAIALAVCLAAVVAWLLASPVSDATHGVEDAAQETAQGTPALLRSPLEQSPPRASTRVVAEAHTPSDAPTGSEPAAPTQSKQIAGKVIASDKPLPGVLVALIPARAPRGVLQTEQYHHDQPPRWASTTTDDAGRFAFEIEPDDKARYRLVASKAGWLQGRLLMQPFPQVLRRPRVVKPGDVDLPVPMIPVRLIALRFEDAKGTPIEVTYPRIALTKRPRDATSPQQAIVNVMPGFDASIMVDGRWLTLGVERTTKPVSEQKLLVTIADGFFPDTASVSLRPPGYARATLDVRLHEPGRVLRAPFDHDSVRLKRSMTNGVRLTVQTQTPYLAGKRIQRSLCLHAKSGDLYLGARVGRLDADRNVWVFDDVPPDTRSVIVWNGVSGSLPTEVTLTPDGKARVTIQLTAPVGMLIYGRAGMFQFRPLPVKAITPWHRSSYEMEIPELGDARFVPIGAGSYQGRNLAPGAPKNEFDFTIRAGEVTVHRIQGE